jgi:predicted neuraminidase
MNKYQNLRKVAADLGTRLVKTSDCKVLKLLIAIRYGKWIIDCYRYEKMDEPFFASLYK